MGAFQGSVLARNDFRPLPSSIHSFWDYLHTQSRFQASFGVYATFGHNNNMGGCCIIQDPASEEGNLRNYNAQLKKLMLEGLRRLQNTPWARNIKQYIKTSDEEFLFTVEYNQDVTELIVSATRNQRQPSVGSPDSSYKKSLHDSCLIPEDQAERLNDPLVEVQVDSFHSKVDRNASLIMQLETVFKPFEEEGPYKQNAMTFLSWIAIAEKHLKLGFLEPLYRVMADEMIKIINKVHSKDSDVLLKKLNLEIQEFARLMYKIYEQVYRFYDIEKSPRGKFFKEENVNHFIIGSLFKTKDLMRLLRSSLIERETQHIQGFEMRLRLLEGKPFDHFNIPPKFQLISRNSILSESGSITAVSSYQSATNILKKITVSQTPVSKLKVLLQAQKQIVKEISRHYASLHQEVPEIEPEIVISLTMFIIVKSRIKQLLVDLSIVEQFSSKNALNSISGYHMQSYNVAISMIESFQE